MSIASQDIMETLLMVIQVVYRATVVLWVQKFLQVIAASIDASVTVIDSAGFVLACRMWKEPIVTGNVTL